tara:strand:- start:150 stop:344 length:195 start_codon:yes stop_codon:yes gene_type:complete
MAARAPRLRAPPPPDVKQEDFSMYGDAMGGGMMGFAMGYGWLFGLLLIVLAVLAIAALFKYLRR